MLRGRRAGVSLYAAEKEVAVEKHLCDSYDQHQQHEGSQQHQRLQHLHPDCLPLLLALYVMVLEGRNGWKGS